LHVSDASSPLSAEQDAQVEKVLKELEVEAKPRLRVLNKIDLLSSADLASLRDDETAVHISSAKGIGLSALLEKIDRSLTADQLSAVRLRIPQNEGKLLALVEAKSKIHSRRYRESFVELEVEAPESTLRKVRKWIVKGRDLYAM